MAALAPETRMVTPGLFEVVAGIRSGAKGAAGPDFAPGDGVGVLVGFAARIAGQLTHESGH